MLPCFVEFVMDVHRYLTYDTEREYIIIEIRRTDYDVQILSALISIEELRKI